MDNCITNRKYSKKDGWLDVFPDCIVKLSKLDLTYDWEEIFKELFENKKIAIIEKRLTNYLQNIELKPDFLYPKPNYVFKAFNSTPFDLIKVVIIGQDPYFNHELYKEKIVPQAYGLSFSVPKDFEVPSSLQNIYRNLYKFGHIKSIPEHGCLDLWAYQGCLMLNSALTVIEGQDNKNCHASEWKWFTDRIIEYINYKSSYVIFVLWGAESFKKIELIDLDHHDVIISSHPSGLSASRPLKDYPAFNNCDCFGQINKFLKANKKTQIVWDL